MTNTSSIKCFVEFQKLIGFDTTSSKSNLELIYWVDNYLRDLKFHTKIILSEDNTKGNLIAWIGEGEESIMFSGHSDTVPVTDQIWSYDPFTATVKDDKIYGRGTCDMKGFLSACLYLAKILYHKKDLLKKRVYIAFTYNEETTFDGVYQLVEYLNTLENKPKLCIVGEPTNMQTATAHKGYCGVQCSIKGKSCHSSLPEEGVSSIHLAAQLVCFIHELANDRKANGPFNSTFQPNYTTIHCGVINGGSALNIIPPACDLSFEIRPIPEDNVNDILTKIEDYARALEKNISHPDCGFSFSKLNFNSLTNDFSDVNSFPSKFVSRFFPNAQHLSMSFATEAGTFYRRCGIPSIVMGPGSISEAHKPDEFVDIDQMIKCEEFFEQIAEFCCS